MLTKNSLIQNELLDFSLMVLKILVLIYGFLPQTIKLKMVDQGWSDFHVVFLSTFSNFANKNKYDTFSLTEQRPQQ